MALPRGRGGALKDGTLPLEGGSLPYLQHKYVIEVPIGEKRILIIITNNFNKGYFGIFSLGSLDSFARPPKMMAF